MKNNMRSIFFSLLFMGGLAACVGINPDNLSEIKASISFDKFIERATGKAYLKAEAGLVEPIPSLTNMSSFSKSTSHSYRTQAFTLWGSRFNETDNAIYRLVVKVTFSRTLLLSVEGYEAEFASANTPIGEVEAIHVSTATMSNNSQLTETVHIPFSRQQIESLLAQDLDIVVTLNPTNKKREAYSFSVSAKYLATFLQATLNHNPS